MWAQLTACLEHCQYCGAPLGQAGDWGCTPGFRYGDGRTICQGCHASAIKTEAQLAAAWHHVATVFTRLGLVVNWDALPVALLDQPVLQQESGSPSVVGLASSRMSLLTVQSNISILYGMPTLWALETLGHEAGHVWCREQRLSFSPPEREEGVCNVLAYLVLQAIPNYDTEERKQAMFANPDPIYGGYFREQWRELEQLGWHAYRQRLLMRAGAA